MATGIVIASDCRRCCMARIFDVILAKSGNPENNSHPEFISGSTKKMRKTCSA
ncbi:hypothetical protein [Rickettsia endosymbiont of Orchestes rusci]|uniref:hypothetical protein n=1 Tax=Rickettsia endosymbiont of Orchestes rusci TaxID=3066250 RepID=UPI00313BD6E1